MSMAAEKEKISCEYFKRKGTSGLGGQLYETKLLTLILVRALYDDNINDFVLGTNIEGIGALDDIVLRYQTKESRKSKILFLQAKHRNDPTKDKLTIEDLFKKNGDFNIHKYLESYFKINQKFLTESKNRMFHCSKADIDCDFVIYTSVEENVDKKKILKHCNEENLIQTTNNGKIFQLDYDSKDIEYLLNAVTKSRITMLAKTVAKFIAKDNFLNILSDDLIKIYHVFLAQNVLAIEPTSDEKCNDSPEYYIGKFRESFLSSDEENFLLMKQVIGKEILDLKGIQTNEKDEIDSILKSYCLKLPTDFGNCNFCFRGSKKKQERRFIYMCSIFDRLLQSVPDQDTKYTFVKLDEDSVGPSGLVAMKDLENYRLGGLIGNLLIIDHETGTYMFNINEKSLSNDTNNILRYLKNKYNLSKFRLLIKIYSFPKLTLNYTEHDIELVKEFLNRLKFYTNQAKEDEIDILIKKEIDKITNFHEKVHNSIYQVKCDAIYLKVHDEVQKWWKQQHVATYLTKTCQFYQQAEREILDSPLLNIFNFIYRNKLKSILVEFEHDAVNILQLDYFLNCDEKVIIITSNEIDFTTVKIIQHFDALKNKASCIFLDLDSLESCVDIVKMELQSSVAKALVVVTRGNRNVDSLWVKINDIAKLFKNKIIIILPETYEAHHKLIDFKTTAYRDNKNKFSCLSTQIRKLILDERKVVFQGVEFTINAVFNSESLDILSPNLLRKIICNERVEIGEQLTDNVYNLVSEWFVERSVCRYITLNVDHIIEKITYISKETNLSEINLSTLEKRDILITTDSADAFQEVCKINNNTNIHWFIKKYEDANLMWSQSQGSLQNIIKHVKKGYHEDFTFQINSLKDIREKVVIISGEPGMGKSILLTHLAINTKQLHPKLWILKINLLDNADQFFEWKQHNTNVDLLKVIIFLHKAVKRFKCNDTCSIPLSEFIKVDNNNIICTDDHDKYSTSKHFSEINLLNYFYNNENLAVVLDGFDEVCPDYSNQAMQLLCILKSSKIAHLWVTSRNYDILKQLEVSLGTFSFNLRHFTASEQKKFLQNVWSVKLGIDRIFDKFYSHYIDTYFSFLENIFGNHEEQFTSLPLHLTMIAEVYQNLYKDYIDLKIRRLPDEYFVTLKATSNLTSLYEKFIDTKFFNIRFGDKKHAMNFKDPDMRKIVDKERKVFMDNHKTLAAYLLLDCNIVLSDRDIENALEFIENVKTGEEKTGIIDCVIDNNPKFVHFTFGEYFAVEFLFAKLESGACPSSLWKYLIDIIFLSDQNGIRRFINGKLQKVNDFATKLKKEHLNVIISSLLSQISLPRHAIYISISENLEHIVQFLLQCFKMAANEANLPDIVGLINKKCDSCCTFCFAILTRQASIVEQIIDIITNIDQKIMKYLFYCSDIFRFNPLLIALQNEQMSHVILRSLEKDPELLVDLFTLRLDLGIVPTTAHFLGRHAEFCTEICWNYFLKIDKERLLKIFSVKDSEGQLPLHYAAEYNIYTFFTAMYILLGKDEFKKMCTTADDTGFTPICKLSYRENFFDDLRYILKVVYDVPDIDLEDFVFYRLPKLHPKKKYLN